NVGFPVNDVWVLTNANASEETTPIWIQLDPTGNVPPVRAGHATVYDFASDRLIVFGGHTDADVFVLNNASGANTNPNRRPTWTRLNPAGELPAGRFNAAVSYDPASNRMIVFGGTSGPNFLNDVWILSNANGQGGTPNWSRLLPAGTPPTPRFLHSSVYDS